MIQTSKALSELCSRMSTASCIALDTEFISGKLPETILSVVQVGFDNEDVTLIDALSFDHLHELKPILEDRNIVKILHDPGQDLGLLAKATGAEPKQIFDIKLAARLLGTGKNYSLSEIVLNSCGIHLSKKQQRSDWLRRPLSSEQLDYAKTDVLYLHRIRELLLSEADRMGRTEWLNQEMSLFDDPHSYIPRTDAERLLSLSSVHHLDPDQRAVVVSLAEWRLQTAMKTNRSATRVLSDKKIMRLAKKRAVKPGAIRSACSSLSHQCTLEIADLIGSALKTPARACPAPLSARPLTVPESAQLQLLQAVVKGRAVKYGIEPELIGTAATLKDFILNPNNSSNLLINGWRWHIMGKDLLELLHGRSYVSVHGGLLQVHPFDP